jgi:hypothetical protein
MTAAVRSSWASPARGMIASRPIALVGRERGVLDRAEHLQRRLDPRGRARHRHRLPLARPHGAAAL